MKKCYVLMPFHADFDPVYDVLCESATENGYNCWRADKKRDIGLLTHSIVLDILTADVILVDISGFNPNVMYEMGYAHTLGKPTIVLSQDLARGSRLPFDISHMLTVPYTLPDSEHKRGASLAALRKNLSRYLGAHTHYANPIVNAFHANDLRIFRTDFDWMWGLADTFDAEKNASEVWTVSRFLFWEQLSPLFRGMVEDRTVSGDRRTLLLLPETPEIVDAADLFLETLRAKDAKVEEQFFILHVASPDVFAFNVTEICIYNPRSADACGVLLEPMASSIGEDPADAEIEESLLRGASPSIPSLKQTTYDIRLPRYKTRQLSSTFRRVWNRNAADQGKPDSWYV